MNVCFCSGIQMDPTCLVYIHWNTGVESSTGYMNMTMILDFRLIKNMQITNLQQLYYTVTGTQARISNNFFSEILWNSCQKDFCSESKADPTECYYGVPNKLAGECILENALCSYYFLIVDCRLNSHMLIKWRGQVGKKKKNLIISTYMKSPHNYNTYHIILICKQLQKNKYLD